MMNPSGLSSRTISPVSVIQAVVFSPVNSISTRNAGIGMLADAHDFALAHFHRHRRISQRRGIEDVPLWTRARREPVVREPAHEVERQHGALGEPPHFRPRAAAARDRDVQVEIADVAGRS